MALTYMLMDCKFLNIHQLNVFGDSLIAINGVNGKFKIEDKNIKYLNILAKYFSLFFE